MTSYAMAEESGETSKVDSALRWIGDLDHPFYSDERNRFVWYEASAIAFQLLFLGSYFVAGLLLWIAGASAIPYTLAMFAPALLAALVFQGYLKRHSAEYWPGKNDLVRRRGQFAFVAPVFVLTGAIRALLDWNSSLDDSVAGGSVDGTIVGVVVGGLAGAAVIAYKSRQQARAEEEDEF